MESVAGRAKKIRLAIFDVDGVLTDGRLLLGDGGIEIKSFHVHDGQGLVMLRESGVEIAVITARSSKVVAERMNALGIEYVYQGQRDKLQAFQALLEKLQFTPDQVLYMGDDLGDVPVMRRVGLAVAVAGATDYPRQVAHYQTRRAGGAGAVREVCELVMQAQGTLAAQLEKLL